MWAPLKCMVQTVRILNIDCSNVLVTDAESYVVCCVIFMRHVFICIYYCSASGCLCTKTYNLFAGEMLHAAREMKIY